MKWEPKRAMNTRPMKTLEARISPLKRGECQVGLFAGAFGGFG